MIHITKATIPIPVDKNQARPIQTDKRFIPDDFLNVAKSMESEFAKFMIDQMNKTVDRQNESQTENIYRDFLSQEQADTMSSSNNGLGIQDVILDQIYPKNLRNKLNYNIYQKQSNAEINKGHANHITMTKPAKELTHE